LRLALRLEARKVSSIYSLLIRLKENRLRKATFGDKLRSVTKVEHGFSLADDLMRAKATVEEAAEIVGELRSDIEQWYENLPDNFRDGDKGNELQECQSALEDLEQ